MAEPVDRINTFLRAAAGTGSFEAVFQTLCERLVAEGLPLWRAAVSYRTLDPVIRARTTAWQRAGAAERYQTGHDEGEGPYLRSPIRHVVDRQLPTARWRLELGEGRTFPLLAELREAGATDYVLHVVRFEVGMPEVPGVAISFASDRPGGFTAADLDQLGVLVPAIGIASSRAVLVQLMGSVLGIYLGRRTARLVLDGEIRRGLRRNIDAGILLADLRGFTDLAEHTEPQALVGWLDERLAAMVDAVEAHGGEVLKFLGDGLLAVFQIEPAGAAAGGELERRAACRLALQAAEAAQAANDALNARDRAAGAPALELDIALHQGEVIYSNVGAPQRLDFTVVGRAVNEASRIEALCAGLGRRLLLSRAFADRCGRPTLSLGLHALRGVDGPREICAVA